jgi:putative peptidoglycan lipid II flippase
MKLFESTLRFVKRGENYRVGFFSSVILNGMAKALGFFTTVLTANFFGSTVETDIFFYSLASIGIVSSFLINLDGTTFIPKYMKMREKGNSDAANDLLRFAFFFYLSITLIIALLITLFPQEWMKCFSRFNRETIESYDTIVRWVAPLLVISTLNFYLIDVLSSFKRFSLSILSAFFSNGINIIIIFLFHNQLGVLSVIMGNVIGGAFQCCYLLFCVGRLSKCRLFPVRIPIDRATINYILFSQGSYLSSLFGSFAPFYMLSGYSAGIISALLYGQRLIDIFSFILVAQFSNVLAIKLNEMFIFKKEKMVSVVFSSIGRLALFVSVPTAFLVSVLCLECISIVFIRGEFRHQEAVDASRFAAVFVFCIPLLLINTMVARLVMAGEKIDKSFGFQSIMGIVIGLLCVGAIFFYGPHAYPYAMIAGYMINLLAVNFIIKRWFAFFKHFDKLLLFGLLLIMANGVIVPVDIFIKKLLQQQHPIAIIMVVGGLHMGLFFALSYLIKLFPPFNNYINHFFSKSRSGYIKTNET